MKYRIASFPLHWNVMNMKPLTRFTFFHVIAELTGLPKPESEKLEDEKRNLKRYNKQKNTTFPSSKYLNILAIDLGNYTMHQIHECLEFFGYIPYTALHQNKRVSTVRHLMKHSMSSDATSFKKLTYFNDINEAKSKLKYYLPTNQIPNTLSKAQNIRKAFVGYNTRDDLYKIQRAIKDNQ